MPQMYISYTSSHGELLEQLGRYVPEEASLDPVYLTSLQFSLFRGDNPKMVGLQLEHCRGTRLSRSISARFLTWVCVTDSFLNHIQLD